MCKFQYNLYLSVYYSKLSFMNKLLFIKIRKLSISCKNIDRRCLFAVEPNRKTILAPREEKIRSNLLYNIK